MLDNGYKLEVEALVNKDISYVTEEYTPQRLKEGTGWTEGQKLLCGAKLGDYSISGVLLRKNA